ncbi:MAG TPA: N-acetylmuramoyl-L-alanine amidase, partial [Spirochaeta sp.]|nr:N-acetylmuramoyl-L-alanine amidase [Spirochaeta sp.]
RTIVRFSKGSPWYLVNMNELRTGLKSELTADGRFLIDSETAADVAAFFEQQEFEAGGVRYIVIDPGHGGKDPGAIGHYTVSGEKKSLNEKDVVLQTALETADMLSARYPDKEILLTRGDDRYLKLEERTEVANSVELAEGESMIFISIHANASFNTKARGFEVWYLPPEYRRDLLDEERFGEVDSDVIPILNTMLEEEYTIESVILGEKLLASLDEEVGDISVNRGPKEESWFVVRNAHMPSVLIELGFVTNQEEAVLLSSSSYLKKLSKGIYNGIVEFINDYELTRGYSD